MDGGRARPGRDRIGQPCRNWGGRSPDCNGVTFRTDPFLPEESARQIRRNRLKTGIGPKLGFWTVLDAARAVMKLRRANKSNSTHASGFSRIAGKAAFLSKKFDTVQKWAYSGNQLENIRLSKCRVISAFDSWVFL